MANVQEAVVTEDIREQAEQLGYIVKQKGRIESSPGSTVCHEIPKLKGGDVKVWSDGHWQVRET